MRESLVAGFFFFFAGEDKIWQQTIYQEPYWVIILSAQHNVCCLMKRRQTKTEVSEKGGKLKRGETRLHWNQIAALKHRTHMQCEDWLLCWRWFRKSLRPDTDRCQRPPLCSDGWCVSFLPWGNNVTQVWAGWRCRSASTCENKHVTWH